MPKYYCDYCDTYLTHDSPSVRKTHCSGRKHRDNVRNYYQKWMEEQAQRLIDMTTAAYKTKSKKLDISSMCAIPPPGYAAANFNVPPPNMLPTPTSTAFQPQYGGTNDANLLNMYAAVPPPTGVPPPPTTTSVNMAANFQANQAYAFDK